MTNPVDTDALVSGLQALASRLNVKNAPGGQDSLLVDAAIEEIDHLRMGLFAAAQDLRKDAHMIARLRAVIENAPHANECPISLHEYFRETPNETVRCICWKAGAL